MMHNFFQLKAAAAVLSPPPSISSGPSLDDLHGLEQEIIAPAEQVNYLSDDWSDDDKSSSDSKVEDEDIPLSEQACFPLSPPQSFPV